MKTKAILSLFVATVFALLAVSAASASLSDGSAITNFQVSINDVDLVANTDVNPTNIAGFPGETVPVVITFKATETLTDLKIELEGDMDNSDVSTSSERFDVVNGSTYIKRLSLTLPSVYDMEENPEGFVLHVEVSNNDGDFEQDYQITMQRESYDLDLLSVDVPTKASAGEILAVDVVLKNIGGRDSEDTFVTVSIPELGVSKKAYFGDIYSDDNYDNEADYDTDNEDARSGRVYLTIPSDAKSGTYSVQVQAYNYDTTATAKQTITIAGIAATNSTNTNTGTNLSSNTDTGKIPTSVIVLTVVLVIVFVVLLVVLIVLLTKKPTEKVEDFGETSYY